MFSNLKHWLFSGAAKPTPRRRNRLAQFRGQIERLETRAVLSGTIGPSPADMELPAQTDYVVEIWENGSAETAWQPRLAPIGNRRIALGRLPTAGATTTPRMPRHAPRSGVEAAAAQESQRFRAARCTW